MNYNWRTVFLEYTSHKPGQHSFTVIETANHKRIIVGRIFHHIDPQTKKEIYIAVDSVGNQIFADHYELQDLKDQFKKHGRVLVQNTLAAQRYYSRNQGSATTRINQRSSEIDNIRSKKSERGLAKVNSGATHSKESTEKQKEENKEMENTIKYKDESPEKSEVQSSKQGQATMEADNNQQDNTDVVSSREDELSEARDQGNDMEAEVER